MICKSCKKYLTDSDFYVSNKSRCKACITAAVKANRIENIEHYRSFDRLRGSLPHRVAARKEYAQTDAGKLAHSKALKKQNTTKPDQRKARIIVGNAVKYGRLFKVPCRDCGSFDVEGHHPDYTKPLFVIWLCNYHHRQEHKAA